MPDLTTEPFSVGMAVVWHQGEERGATMTFGSIKEVKGEIYYGTLICEFNDETAEFYKKNGDEINGNGRIRLATGN